MTECVSIEANAIEANAIEANAIDTNAIEANAIDTNAIEAKNNHLIYILNACGIICNSFSQLDGLLIQREVLINDEKYAHIIKTELPILKKHFSSSYLTSLQSTATSKQKFPLLNLIRQLLRSCNYKLTPKRISDGYTLAGDKKYKRMFIVEKMRV